LPLVWARSHIGIDRCAESPFEQPIENTRDRILPMIFLQQVLAVTDL
jgi:hypothetical protein